MASNNTLLTAGISTTSTQVELTPEDLAPNNYLTLIWKDTQTGKLATLDIDDEKMAQYTYTLNNAIESALTSTLTYAGQTSYINIEAIAKYIAQNNIPAGVQRSVVNALIGWLTGNTKSTTDRTVNLLLNVFGTVAERAAKAIGYTDPHEIFSQIAGENVLSVLKELGSKAKDYIDECLGRINNNETTNLSSADGENKKKYVGLLLGLTTSDTESYDITIPRKKVEDGSDYTTHLLPQPFKKDFTVILTNKVLTSEYDRDVEITNIEFVKDKLIEIAQSHTLFDIYIRLSPNKIYKRSNLSFSSLSFTKDEGSGNNYTATFTVEPVENFKSKVFISNKKYGSTNSSTNRKQANNTTKGDKLKIEYYGNTKPPETFNDVTRAKEWARNNNQLLVVSESFPFPKFKFVHVDDTKTLKEGTALKDDCHLVNTKGFFEYVLRNGINWNYTFKPTGVTSYKLVYQIINP